MSENEPLAHFLHISMYIYIYIHTYIHTYIHMQVHELLLQILYLLYLLLILYLLYICRYMSEDESLAHFLASIGSWAPNGPPNEAPPVAVSAS
jgi:hypothetical protein